MASDDAVLTREAIGRWDRGLRSLDPEDPGLQELRELRFFDRRAMTVARPALITRPRLEAERLAVALVGRALAKVLARVHAEPALLDRLGLSAAAKDLATIDPGFTNVDVNDRFDAFFSKRMGFVEVNGASPGGMGLVDAATRAFMRTALFEEMTADYTLEPIFAVPRLREAMLAAWQDWGGTGDPVIAIVDWADGPLIGEFELIAEHLRAHGLRTLIVDPRELRFEGGRLRHEDEEIDLVYRRVISQDCLARPDEVAPLVEAARAGAACLVNPFASDVLSHKRIFDLMTDPEVDLDLTAAERAAIANHVPWTRRLVADGATAATDTVPRRWTVDHRAGLVLKPANDYGGHGVHLGWECDDAEWAALVDAALAEDTLIQRRVVDHVERFPADEPGFPLRAFHVDTDPYVFRGQMGGVLVRLSVDGVTNVTAGGSLAPALVIGPA
jgi:hypothetical protein